MKPMTSKEIALLGEKPTDNKYLIDLYSVVRSTQVYIVRFLFSRALCVSVIAGNQVDLQGLEVKEQTAKSIFQRKHLNFENLLVSVRTPALMQS